jgi:hypothetical protein
MIYRHIILAVPAMFRTTFYHNAALLLSALMRCGVQCLDDFYSEVRGKALRHLRQDKPGFFWIPYC